MDEFQWFLIALSVRPLSSFEMSAHLWPTSSHAVKMTSSSASVHGPLLISGERWLCHLRGRAGRGRGRGQRERLGGPFAARPHAHHAPLAALLAHAAGKLLSDQAPLLGAVNVD